MTSHVRVRPATLAALSTRDATSISSCRGAGAAALAAAAASSSSLPASCGTVFGTKSGGHRHG